MGLLMWRGCQLRKSQDLPGMWCTGPTDALYAAADCVVHQQGESAIPGCVWVEASTFDARLQCRLRRRWHHSGGCRPHSRAARRCSRPKRCAEKFTEYQGTVEALEVEAAALIAQQKDERGLLPRLQSATAVHENAVASAQATKEHLEELRAKLPAAEAAAAKAAEQVKETKRRLDALHAELAAVREPMPSPEVPGTPTAATALGALESLVNAVKAAPPAVATPEIQRLGPLLEELNAILTGATAAAVQAPATPAVQPATGDMESAAVRGAGKPNLQQSRGRSPDGLDDDFSMDDGKSDSSGERRSRSRLRREEAEAHQAQMQRDIAAGRQRTLEFGRRTTAAQ